MTWSQKCQQRRWHKHSLQEWTTWIHDLDAGGFGRFSKQGWKEWVRKMMKEEGEPKKGLTSQGKPAQGRPAQGPPSKDVMQKLEDEPEGGTGSQPSAPKNIRKAREDFLAMMSPIPVPLQSLGALLRGRALHINDAELFWMRLTCTEMRLCATAELDRRGNVSEYFRKMRIKDMVRRLPTEVQNSLAGRNGRIEMLKERAKLGLKHDDFIIKYAGERLLTRTEYDTC